MSILVRIAVEAIPVLRVPQIRALQPRRACRFGAQCTGDLRAVHRRQRAPRMNSVTPNSACWVAARHLTTPRTSLEWLHHLARALDAP